MSIFIAVNCGRRLTALLEPPAYKTQAGDSGHVALGDWSGGEPEAT